MIPAGPSHPKYHQPVQSTLLVTNFSITGTRIYFAYIKTKHKTRETGRHMTQTNGEPVNREAPNMQRCVRVGEMNQGGNTPEGEKIAPDIPTSPSCLYGHVCVSSNLPPSWNRPTPERVIVLVERERNLAVICRPDIDRQFAASGQMSPICARDAILLRHQAACPCATGAIFSTMWGGVNLPKVSSSSEGGAQHEY